METQKNVNLLNGSKNEYSKSAKKKKKKKWCLITSESKSDYSHEDPIKLLTKSIESIFYAYILVTGNIAVTRTIAAKPNANPAVEKKKEKQPLTAATQVAFKNCAPFKDCRTEIGGTFVDYADFINITMPM